MPDERVTPASLIAIRPFAEETAAMKGTAMRKRLLIQKGREGLLSQWNGRKCAGSQEYQGYG
jgi:hypothetical protein